MQNKTLERITEFSKSFANTKPGHIRLINVSLYLHVMHLGLL